MTAIKAENAVKEKRRMASRHASAAGWPCIGGGIRLRPDRVAAAKVLLDFVGEKS
jgi:hypothetical protein